VTLRPACYAGVIFFLLASVIEPIPISRPMKVSMPHSDSVGTLTGSQVIRPGSCTVFVLVALADATLGSGVQAFLFVTALTTAVNEAP